MDVLKCAFTVDSNILSLLVSVLVSFYSALFLWLYSVTLSANSKKPSVIVNKPCLKCQLDSVNLHKVSSMSLNEQWSRKINSTDADVEEENDVEDMQPEVKETSTEKNDYEDDESDESNESDDTDEESNQDESEDEEQDDKQDESVKPTQNDK
jgi:hypothetical protein